MNDLMELALWIDMEIVDRNQQAEREGWTFWTLPMPADCWNRDYGYTTPAEVIEHQIIETYHDWHKDRYCYRPTWLRGCPLPRVEIARKCEREMDKWAREDEEHEKLMLRKAQEQRTRIARNRAVATKNTQLADQLADLLR